MDDSLLVNVFRFIVASSAAFNFCILVFFYERDATSRRKVLYSICALSVAIGQLYLFVTVFNGAIFEWPQVVSQVGLAVAIAASLGGIKRAAAFLTNHGDYRATKLD